MKKFKYSLLLATLSLLPALAVFADGPGEIAFDEDSISVIEENGSVLVVIERSRGEDGAVSIDYATTGGTATEGSDYTGVSGTLTWSDQDGTNRVVEVAILDDAEAEGLETIELSLSNPTGGAIIRAGRGTSVINIQASDGGTGGGGGGGGGGDDDGPGEIAFDEDSISVIEENGSVLVVIERSRGEDGAVSIDYATTGGTATEGSDYTGISGTLTWSDQDGTNRVVEVAILDDAEAEGLETIELSLSNPTGGAIIRAGRGTSVINIQASDGGTGGGGGGGGDDDGPGEIAFDEDSISVIEENGSVLVVIERSRGEDGAVSIDYATTGGTATEGSDYTGVSGTLTWGDQDGTNRVVEVAILDDAEAEGLETIELSLSNPTGGAIIRAGRGTSVINIQPSDGGTGGGGGGDDGTGRFKFDQRGFISLEDSSFAVISVERSQGEDGSVTVDYSTSDGSASEGSDYEAAFGTLSWTDGDGSLRTFMVAILNDDADEASETVNLALSNPTGGATLDPERSTAVLTILDDDQGGGGGGDDDPGVIKFDQLDTQIVEGDVMATIRVERSMGGAGAVTVDYTVADGSATDGLDYQGTSGTLFWADGDETDQVFQVLVLEDDLEEGNETVLLELSNPSGGAVLDATRSSASLTILDNDGQTAACQPGSNTHCLLDGRFKVEVNWRTRTGSSDRGNALGLTDNSGLFWFFNQNNVEMLVKVLDACNSPGFQNYWVFFAATTNVNFTLTVTDTSSGITKQYQNPLGQAAAPVQDTFTFDTCP